MKREVIASLFTILLLPLISAAFSASEVFSFIDAQTIFLLVSFGVLGLLLSVILNKFPIFQGKTAGIISVLLSIGMTYGINKWFSVNDLFSDIGITGDTTLYLLIALLVVFIISLFVFKWKTLLIFGLLLILMALFTDLAAEKTIVLIVGIVLVVISLIWGFGHKKLNPRLVAEAKAYRQFADKQTAPKMLRNWAHFIGYLKQRGYGNNENEIAQRMSVTLKDIQRATKKYII